MEIRRIVLNRDGAVMNESSVKVPNRTEALSWIFNEQRAFAASGYNDAKRCYWARPDERDMHLHQWRIIE